ncbi:MAG: hypothetical protein ACYDCK_00460 [Thermoplasmatota archaeon]
MRRPRSDGAASQILAFIVAFGILASAIGIYFLYPQLLGERSASASAYATARADAYGSSALLAGTEGFPLGWCAAGTTPTRFGIATANGSGIIDPCKLRALHDQVNNPTGISALAASLGLAPKGAPRSFHIRAAPFGTANASGVSAALANVTAIYVGHPGQLEGPAEEAALMTLGLNFSSSAVDPTGTLVRGDAADDSSSLTFDKLVAPRLAGFDFVQNDPPLSGSDASYWKVLDAHRFLEDAGLGATNAMFGAPPIADRIMTPGHYESDDMWHVDAGGTGGVRDFRLVALVNLTELPPNAVSLAFSYHLEPGTPAQNVAKVEACIWPCATLAWTTLATLPAFGASLDPGGFTTPAPVSLAPLHLGTRLVFISFTYHVVAAQSSPDAGFFVAHPHLEANGADLVPDWTKGNTSRTLGAFVVGTNVDQRQLGSAFFARAVSNFVAGGGEVLALGSTTIDPTWLKDTVAQFVAVAGSSPLVAGGDMTHPLLKEPFAIDATKLTTSSPSYTALPGFASVLASASKDANGAPVPLIEASLPQPNVEGAVVLARFTPGYAANAVDDLAPHFLGNALLFGALRSAYIDFGSVIPNVTTVAQSTRTLDYAPDGSTNEPPVAGRVHLTVYVW